jgi:3-isopropylmalate dehydrogenase
MTILRRVVVLPGDGVGPEVTEQAERALIAAAAQCGVTIRCEHGLIGAVAVRTARDPLPASTREACAAADAILLGAVGDPSLDGAPRHLRPETGLLGLRRALGLYLNLRPVKVRASLAAISPLKAERLGTADLLVVRELAGGLYYGEPRGRYGVRAVNTMSYERSEIERVARPAFEAARARRRRVTSVDKANVLEVSQLWREVVTEVAREYPDVTLEHQLVDSAAMRLITDPGSFDVIVTENMFGDILSDEAAVLAGSIGLLPSASLGDGPGLYEPIHGSAPDLAGRDAANPIGAILSSAMLLRHTLKIEEGARLIEQAVERALASGLRTRDIAGPDERRIGTSEFGDYVVQAIRTAGTVSSMAALV